MMSAWSFARIAPDRVRVMPNITLSLPHQLPRAEAKKRVEELVGQFHQQVGGMGRLEETWTGDTMAFTFSVAGTAVTGKVFVEDQAVRMEVNLPWALAMFAGGIKQRIEQEGRKMLGHRPSGAGGTG
jgi:putative polyhydroxyalkanoate system protein